jgi:proton-translocating NADH-quinone oxidoreductase chain M
MTLIFKKFIFYISIFLYILTLIIWFFYDENILGYQFLYKLNIFNLKFYFGLDGLSLFFFYLTSFLVSLCLLLFFNNLNSNTYYSMFCLLGLEVLILLVFISIDFILFYLFFEIILIPFFILIGIRSVRKRRVLASYYLFFYTIIGSFAMLIGIVYLYLLYGTSNIIILSHLTKNIDEELYLFILFFFSFSIKIPMFPFHSWLPEAHVEAPTEGSVILAGIILKIGVYGIIRFLFNICNNVLNDLSFIVCLIASMSVLYCSFSTLIQTDLKRIIAYSSIAHMNIAILGLFSLNIEGFIGCMLIMIGHGFISSGLSFLIGFIYLRTHSKLLKYYSGLVFKMPILTFFLFLFVLGNVSLPLTSNFIGELLILLSIYITKNFILLIVFFFGVFLCTLYTFIMFNKVVFGLPNINMLNISDITLNELCILIPIIFHIFWIGIYPLSWIDIIYPTGYIFLN